MQKQAVVVGGGIGGLCAAIELARHGFAVQLFDAQAQWGGKMATRPLAGRLVNVGPSVLTLRHVFDRLFARAGMRLDDWVRLRRLNEVGRHYFCQGQRPNLPFDLCADVRTNAEAVGERFGRQAKAGYVAYAKYCEQLWTTASDVFVFSPKPSLWQAALHFGRRAFRAGVEMDAQRTMHQALLHFFPDCAPLRQLFGRYATYAGSSPLRAPATFHLIGYVEQLGSWAVEGGLAALAGACAQLAERLGVRLTPNTPIASLCRRRGAVCGVRLTDGSEVPADVVVFAGDKQALQRPSLWGAPADDAVAQRPLGEGLSGVVTTWVAPPVDYPLAVHTVFFGEQNEEAEYRAVFEEKRIAPTPNLYVCAPDRAFAPRDTRNETLFCLVNAPPSRRVWAPQEQHRWQMARRQQLQRYGLRIAEQAEALLQTPADFAARFYGSDGVLYGPPAHAWNAFFQRPGSHGPIRGLYLAGGTVHPGPGVPMAATSGVLAARAACADFLSTSM